MRKFVFVLLIVGAFSYLVFGGGFDRLKEYRVSVALVDAGYSQPRAECMARRMVKRLSIVQLWKLRRFSDENHGFFAALKGAARVDDSEAVSVTASSAALCSVGLAH